MLQEIRNERTQEVIVRDFEGEEYDCTFFSGFAALYDQSKPERAVMLSRALARKVPEFSDIGGNTDSVGQLLVGFFRFYLAEFDWAIDVASIRTSIPLSKEDKRWTNPKQQRNFLCVEDPFETDFNVARTLAIDCVNDLRYEMLRAYFMLCNTRFDLQRNVLQRVQEKVVGE